jgi:phospholysine phosphohistidine inorganic pyrophosphate phosphatase
VAAAGVAGALSIRAVLFDLDGTLYQQGRAIPGAAEAVAAIRAAGFAVGFVTNTTSRPRRVIHQRLLDYGFAIDAAEIATALRAGAAFAREQGLTRVAPYVPEAACEDLTGFALTQERPEALIVGDLDTAWDFTTLNRAFRHLMDGARLLALSRDRYWLAEDGLRLDSGTFVAALEYATGVKSELCGKPSPTFYRAASATLGGVEPAEVLMVGDDLWSDIEGARQAGLRTCLVQTGKFRADVFEQSGVRPDYVVGSVNEVAKIVA